MLGRTVTGVEPVCAWIHPLTCHDSCKNAVYKGFCVSFVL